MTTTASRTTTGSARTLVARTVRIDEDGSLLALLPAPAAEAFAWVREGDGLVGWGEVARIEVDGPGRFTRADEAWRDFLTRVSIDDEVGVPGSGPVAFGTFAFDERSGAADVLVVPRVVVGRRDGATWCTVIDADADAHRDTAPHPPAAAPGHDDAAPAPHGAVTFAPGALAQDAWTGAVAEAVAAIRAGEVAKVVLARDVVARAERPIDVGRVLRRLADGYPTCWTFAVDGVLGATPELLVRTRDGRAVSRVLAGTVASTGDAATDREQATWLRNSAKDREEHDYAVRSLVQALRPFASSVSAPQAPAIVPLPNVLHLASDVSATLEHREDGTLPTSLELAGALHPTAAVCGTPTQAARELIARLEGMDRGRYAGPVGWIGADGDGEWGIALRSAELDPADGRVARLFAGGGIVADSEPDAELAETEAKLAPMRWALG